jgi:polyisoprenoid-binding protein YceI
MGNWRKLSLVVLLFFSFKANANNGQFLIKGEVLILRMQHVPLGRFDTLSKEFFEAKINVQKNKVTLEPALISIETRSLESQVPLRDDHLYNVLEAEKFPFLELSEIKINPESKNFTGKLKVRSVQHSVSGAFNLDLEKGMVIVEFADKLTRFGIKPPVYMGVGVKDDFEIIVEAKLIPLKAVD